MAESVQLRTILADFDFEAAGGSAVTICQTPKKTIINLRGRPGDQSFSAAVLQAIGTPFPEAPNHWSGDHELAVVWLAPEEWLIMAAELGAGAIESRIRQAVGEDPWLAVTDVSQTYTGFVLNGPSARDVLAKGCSIDLHPRNFGPGDCAQTLLAKTRVLLRHTGRENEIEVWVRNSFARYAATWLIDAMAEFK